jgi:hypothetical protein
MTFKRNSYLRKHKCSCNTEPAEMTENLNNAPGEDLHKADFIFVQVKVKSENYIQFFEFMRQCPYIYQEDMEVLTTDTGTSLQTTTDTEAPVNVLLSPVTQDYLDSVTIPMAKYILGGPQSQIPDTCNEVEGCEDGWMLAPGELTPAPFGTTIDMDLFEEFISGL